MRVKSVGMYICTLVYVRIYYVYVASGRACDRPINNNITTC